MPNHIHGIIIINPFDEKHNNCRGGRDVACNVSTDTDKNMSNISPKKGSLSVIIRSFKSAVMKYANENMIDNFLWQERFYDRIIRNEKELFNIRKYIDQNPLRWSLERNTPNNLTI